MTPEAKSYEAQILQQLIKNAERIAIIETRFASIEAKITSLEAKVTGIEKELNEVKTKVDRAEWWFRFIAGAIILSIFKEQLMSLF